MKLKARNLNNEEVFFEVNDREASVTVSMLSKMGFKDINVDMDPEELKKYYEEDE